MSGKHSEKYGAYFKNAKVLLTMVAVSLVLFTLIGGTVAWIVANTDSVVNTFTYGDINIDLEETDTQKDNDNDPNTNKYPMIPGSALEKDPWVTVKGNSENAWLFVKLEESANFDDFLEYSVILDDPATTDVVEGWTALENADGVYWRAVEKSAEDAEFGILVGDEVKVKESVTKEMLNALDKNTDGTMKDEADVTYPTLTVTAYAVQRENIATAADAWAKIQPAQDPGAGE